MLVTLAARVRGLVVTHLKFVVTVNEDTGNTRQLPAAGYRQVESTNYGWF